jgi:hypothetical protein
VQKYERFKRLKPTTHSLKQSTSRNHGSRITEKEEEIFDSEDQDEAQIKKSQSIGQCDYCCKLVIRPASVQARSFDIQRFVASSNVFLGTRMRLSLKITAV